MIGHDHRPIHLADPLRTLTRAPHKQKPATTSEVELLSGFYLHTTIPSTSLRPEVLSLALTISELA